MKGRPPGTPKSDDPNKRKRKRNARERDLCDVKIKITEYFPEARTFIGHEFEDGTATTSETNGLYTVGEPYPSSSRQHAQPYGSTVPTSSIPGSNGEVYYTIQRVNGNGGNGKGDGVAGPHKHTLEESDRVKKNSIQRNMLKQEKEKKKSQVSSLCIAPPRHFLSLREGSARIIITSRHHMVSTLSTRHNICVLDILLHDGLHTSQSWFLLKRFI